MCKWVTSAWTWGLSSLQRLKMASWEILCFFVFIASPCSLDQREDPQNWFSTNLFQQINSVHQMDPSDSDSFWVEEFSRWGWMSSCKPGLQRDYGFRQGSVSSPGLDVTLAPGGSTGQSYQHGLAGGWPSDTNMASGGSSASTYVLPSIANGGMGTDMDPSYIRSQN